MAENAKAGLNKISVNPVKKNFVPIRVNSWQEVCVVSVLRGKKSVLVRVFQPKPAIPNDKIPKK